MMSSFEWMELQSLSTDIAEARARLAEARAVKDNRLVRTIEQEITAAEAQRAKIVMQLSNQFADNPEQSRHSMPQDTIDESAPVLDALLTDAASASDPMLDEVMADASAGDGLTADESDGLIPGEQTIDELAPIGQMTPAHPPNETEDSAAENTEEAVAAISDAEPPRQEPKQEVTASTSSKRTALAETTTPRNGKGGTIVWDQLTPSDLERAKDELVTRRTEMLTRHAEELKALEADSDQLAELEQAITAFLRKFNAASEGDVVKLGDERELRASRA